MALSGFSKIAFGNGDKCVQGFEDIQCSELLRNTVCLIEAVA